MSVFRHVRLLNDNAQSYPSEYVMQFLKSEKVTALPHCPDLAPCNFSLLFFQNFDSSYLLVVTNPNSS